MMEWRSSSSTRKERKNRSDYCRERNGSSRAFSLPAKDRFMKPYLHKSGSLQFLQAIRKIPSFENFNFTGFDENLLENSSFKEFLSKVNCPFCLKPQSDKTILIKHLDETCSMKMKHRSKLYAIFQIFPSNAISCNVCPKVVLTTIASYFLHLYDDNHVSKCSEVVRAGKEFTDLLYCACCKILVPNNYIQIQSHVQNEIHEIRRKSSLKPEHYLRRGIHFVYCFHNANTRFKCLLCPAHDFLFKTPWDIFNHFKSPIHKKNIQTKSLLSGVYCCFCDEEINRFEMQDHFTSEEHMENENSVTAEGSYQLCLYCGFTCNTPNDLSAHMKLNCKEIKKIRREKGWKVNEDSAKNKMQKNGETSSRELEKKPCILVKSKINISKLLKILTKFGKITCIKTYNNEYMMVEFLNETAVESILLVQRFIKIYKEVDIKFPEEVQENKSNETDITDTD